MHQDFMHVAKRDLRIGTPASVSPTVGMTVGRKVLGRRRHSFALQAEDLLDAELANQIRRFAITFDRPSPTRIPNGIQNRRVDIGVSQRPSLFAGDHADTASQFSVKRCTDPELAGKVTGVLVADSANPFVGKINRDSQPSFFDKPTLDIVEQFAVLDMPRISLL